MDLHLGVVLVPVIGALIVRRHRGHRLGWLFCAAGVAMGAALSIEEYAVRALAVRPGLGHTPAQRPDATGSCALRKRRACSTTSSTCSGVSFQG
jgi:hypothetical protein